MAKCRQVSWVPAGMASSVAPSCGNSMNRVYKSFLPAAVKWFPSWPKNGGIRIISVFLNNVGSYVLSISHIQFHILQHKMIFCCISNLDCCRWSPVLWVKRTCLASDSFGNGFGYHNILAMWYLARDFTSLNLCLLLQNKPYRDFCLQEHIQVMDIVPSTVPDMWEFFNKG